MPEPQLVPLGSLLTGIDAGHSPDVEDTPARSGEWGVLKVSAVGADGFHPQENKVVREQRLHNPALCVRAGDLLITRANTAQLVGLACIAEDTPAELMLSDKTLRLRVDERVAPERYIQAALGSPIVRRQIENLATGTSGSMKNISQRSIQNLMIPFSGKEDAEQIAEILDSADDQIYAAEDVITKLATALVGITDQLMRSGISGTAGTLRIGELGDFIHLQRGFDITAAEQREGAVPVVSSSGITSYHDLAMVKGPGVVIGRKGKLGDAYYVVGDFWPHDTTLWVTDFKGNDPKFIAHFLKWMRLERLDAATSVPTLNRNFVHPLQVAIPDTDEQRRIVAELEGWGSRIQSEEDRLAKLRTLKQGLMDDLLTGRVRAGALGLGVEFVVRVDVVRWRRELVEVVFELFRVPKVSPQAHTLPGS